MRTGKASRHQRLLQLFERHAISAVEAGLFRIRVEDQTLQGDTITVRGRRLLNFGSCAYLGLNLDPRLKEGARRAVERFGPVFSSSSAYTSVDLYTLLEERLRRIVEATVVVPTTTTLGHLACLPVLISEGDAVLVDSQAHSSIHLATQVLIAEGIPVTPLPHNDVQVLEEAVRRASQDHGQVWYVADGIYSMFGDVAPVHEVQRLLETYPRLHVYYDDAHGFGWQGLHGRGFVLDQVDLHPRMVVAASLAKSFGSGGAVLVFPDEDLARRVQLVGGTLTFSGPVHPAELGAAVASADIHLSDEHAQRRAELVRRIELMGSLLADRGLPVASTDPTPIWFLRVGGLRQAMDLTRRLMDDGFYVNLSGFPAVPVGQSGLRFNQTLYHTDEQLEALVDAIALHLPAVMEGEPEEIVIDLTAEEEPAREAAHQKGADRS